MGKKVVKSDAPKKVAKKSKVEAVPEEPVEADSHTVAQKKLNDLKIKK